MTKAARAIIIENGKILLMYRNKYGSEYYTLVGGRVNDGETVEQGLAREVKEETGLTVTNARLVFTEAHAAPYNEQSIYLCEVAPHEGVAIQESSEEGGMNRLGMNMHKPIWCHLGAFEAMQFRTPQLHAALLKAFKKGFPDQPQEIQ